MKYELINPITKNSGIEQVLLNRLGDKCNIQHFLHTTDEDINDFKLLGEDNLQKAAKLLLTVISMNKKAVIIVDADCDGFTSAAILINYLAEEFPEYVNNNLDWKFHSGKQHGVSDLYEEIINNGYCLCIVPDAGSNEVEYHKKLFNQGIDVIILDHHIVEDISAQDYAVIINNQSSNYPNKFLSGAGVVWQFCRYLDTLTDMPHADNYLDLVALGLVGDMMSLSELETKHLVTKGFKNKNLHNPFITNIFNKNAYKLGNQITPFGAAFYIAPFINAIVRSGTQEEKEIVFNSMLENKAYEEILSNKRGHKQGETEFVVMQAMRTITNVKNRQTKIEDNVLERLEKEINENNLFNEPMFLFLIEPSQIDNKVAGLIANKIANKYQRPCAILFDTGEFYQGSARGYTKTGIDDFKSICLGCGCEYALGHSNAFGLSISKKNLEIFRKNIFCQLKELNKTTEIKYQVDYIFDKNFTENDLNIIQEIASYPELWGQDIDEPIVIFDNVLFTTEDIKLLSPDKNPTLKIILRKGNLKIDCIKFNSSKEEYENLIPNKNGGITINIVGNCALNDWQGNCSPQIKIIDYEIVNSVNYFF